MKLPVYYDELSPEQRRLVREEYVKLQSGKCYFCKESLSLPPPKTVTDKEIDWSLFPDNFLKYPVHLQHSHETKLTEGAVHAYCNAIMWQYHQR